MLKSDPTNGSIAPLLALAGQLGLHRLPDAAGRCLSASLHLALVARRELGLDVRLVKWRVVGDPSYADHWAIALDDQTVLDPTRVQVDGSTRLVHAVAAYPVNFRTPRRYPASLLLDAYEACQDVERARLPDAFVWCCGTRVLGFDLVAALRRASPGALAAVVAEFFAFAWRYNTRRVIEALERRARTLQGRLASSPGPATRPSPVLGRLAFVGTAITPALAAPINSACSLLLACAPLAGLSG